jgi:hypothetical protein
MGWSIGFDSNWGRDVGYGVPATCDQLGCGKPIDRGLAYVCGGQPYGGEYGCGLFFCTDHLMWPAGEEERGEEQLCQRCLAGQDPFAPTPDTVQWMTHKLTDPSWAQWRAENPVQVDELRAALG